MEKDISLNNTHHEQQVQPQYAESAPFNWQASDTAHLLPTNIPKVQRAWERRPLPPFSKQKARVGKVWKRAPTSVRVAAGSEPMEGRVAKRRRSRNSSDLALKPVKKMCLDSHFGIGARVLAWEGAESPARKIVTRSNAAEEDIVALTNEEGEPEAVEEEEEADITIEILDEDGTVLDVNPDEGPEVQDEWEDEEDEGEGEGDGVFEGTLMHLGDVIDGPQRTVFADAPSKTMLNADLDESALAHPNENAEKYTLQDINNASDVDSTGKVSSMAEQLQSPVKRPVEDVTLPDGFISPVKGRALAGRSTAGRSFGSRRRTLPVQFAPTMLADASTVTTHQIAETAENETVGEEASLAVDVVIADDNQEDNVVGEKKEVEQDWEDVEEDSPAAEADQVDQIDFHNFEAMQNRETTAVQPDTTMGNADDDPFQEEEEPKSLQLFATKANDISPFKLPSSPIPTIEGQHPRLPLRRSPRRKSSSPLKQSNILPSTEKPHLVAFTPVKGAAQYLPSFVPPEPISESDDTNPSPSSPPDRAASAPPEEPQMSPQKPSRPRVSDDTALLQAFLNRAAENKSSRRISAAKRESITNRRDSDAVRYALASPQAKNADVLAELDPNSPSPRKPAATFAVDSGDQQQVGGDASSVQQEPVQDDDPVEDAISGLRTRRSGRAATKSKAQPATPVAPNKIAIRGNAENVVLKRTEAQGLALITRNNTRKNKGGAVLPPFRLTKLTSQLSNNSDSEAGTAENVDDAMAERAEGARGVKWAETLVEYFQGGEVSEVSALSDELDAAPDETGNTESEPAPTPVVAALLPPSETPSKPKIRRLKAPTRTAAMPGKPSSAPAEAQNDSAPESAQPSSKPAAAPTKKRSRIATPAKGLGSSVLLPADMDSQPVSLSATSETKKTAPTRKKAPLASKLPAPASASVAAVGQGKENNLISSPPKKKAAAPTAGKGMPTAKNFAPRLDFGKTAKLEPVSQGSEAEVPGLASPAKKGARSRDVIFAGKSSESEEASVGPGRVEMPGLSSPAKKRTRRAVG